MNAVATRQHGIENGCATEDIRFAQKNVVLLGMEDTKIKQVSTLLGMQ